MNEEESQQSIECKAAIRAALEKVGEYCGLGEMSYSGKDKIEKGVPGEAPDYMLLPDPIGVVSISDPIRWMAENKEQTADERIDTIKKSWEGRGTAEMRCGEPFDERESGETKEECIDRIVTLIAERLVYLTDTGERDG